jgi:HEAT repeat protein
VGEYRIIVGALFDRLVEAVDCLDYPVATLIAADLKAQIDEGSERPADFQEVVHEHLGRLQIDQVTDRAFQEFDQVKEACFEEFNTFVELFHTTMSQHLLDRLREEEDRRIRKSLLLILSSFAEEIIPDLARRMANAEWYYLRNLIHILGESGSEAAVRPVASQLEHRDPRVRRAALVALTQLDSPRAMRFVVRVLEEDKGANSRDHDQVRVEAARYLSRCPHPAARHALRQGVLSRRPAVAHACRELLRGEAV